MNSQFGVTLFAILEELRVAKISHALEITRDDSITIRAAVPGERWEVDVFQNGEVYFETFRSDRNIASLEELHVAIRRFSDE